MSSITQIATSLLYSAPLLLAWVVMAGIGIARWQTHPRTSKLVVGAAAVLLVGFVLGMGLRLLVPEVLKMTGMGYSSMSVVYGAVGFFHSCIEAAGWALLLYAAYQGRQEYSEG